VRYFEGAATSAPLRMRPAPSVGTAWARLGMRPSFGRRAGLNRVGKRGGGISGGGQVQLLLISGEGVGRHNFIWGVGIGGRRFPPTPRPPAKGGPFRALRRPHGERWHLLNRRP
jgi:hypothetical protein